MAYIKKFDGNTDTTVTLGKEGNPNALEGYFLGTKETPDTGYGPGKLHIFQTGKGTVGVWGKTRLNNLLTSDLIGQMTLVEFTGMVPSRTKGRKPSFGFQVHHDKDNTVDTSGVNLSAQDPQEPESDEEDDNNVEETYKPTPQPRMSMPAQASSDERRAKVQALLNSKNRS